MRDVLITRKQKVLIPTWQASGNLRVGNTMMTVSMQISGSFLGWNIP
jgi:hypothetical protein